MVNDGEIYFKYIRDNFLIKQKLYFSHFPQIATFQLYKNVRICVSVPPRIHHVSNNGALEVKKGSTVTLECKASGNPVPTITWSRKVRVKKLLANVRHRARVN